MQLNYFGAIRMIMALMPHFRERERGHIINVSSIGVQTSPPRFSAYVASKAALDGFTRCVGSEVIGDGVTFTTIHMPLVKTPMIAPTKIYDSFPTITPDEAADMICEAMRSKPKHIGTRLGTFGEVAYALQPKAVDQILHMAYKVFPDSARARGAPKEGEKPGEEEKASTEAVALAHLMRGVHW
jgi:NAD(P)-dependent dehydrogenase (short-subunit alcohol dehydrogenase family)